MFETLVADTIGNAPALKIVATVADLLIIWYVIYRLVLVIRGTKAVQALVGLVLLLIAYLAARVLNLTAFYFLLDNFFSNLLIIFIVVFHQDIRKLLSQMGQNPFFRRVGTLEEIFYIEELVKAASTLSSKKIGALIVIERGADLTEYSEDGTRIDAAVSKELILAIMHTTSPIHDGAILVQDRMMTYAGCVLPLTTNPRLSRELGTRHRAAIGISEETDALVVVVSEETGKISFVSDGKITRDLTASMLKKVLQRALGMVGPASRQWSPVETDPAKRRTTEQRRSMRSTMMTKIADAQKKRETATVEQPRVEDAS